jgi:hypothetical protein
MELAETEELKGKLEVELAKIKELEEKNGKIDMIFIITC